MLRTRLIPAGTLVVLSFVGIALAGCTSASAPSWMPSWLTIKPPAPAAVTLQFESEPPGADVHTVDGQTCKTPCSLALPLTTQAVSFGLAGYLPQTLSVEVAQSGDNFQPNPVQVTLQSTPKPAAKPKPRKPKVAATTKPPKAKPAAAAPAAPEHDSSFPPPPPPAQLAAPSPFPPPPQAR